MFFLCILPAQNAGRLFFQGCQKRAAVIKRRVRAAKGRLHQDVLQPSGPKTQKPRRFYIKRALPPFGPETIGKMTKTAASKNAAAKISGLVFSVLRGPALSGQAIKPPENAAAKAFKSKAAPVKVQFYNRRRETPFIF